MNIQQKIAEIQRQPEHIRLRWLYGSVTVAMAVIVLIWMLSVTVNFHQQPSTQKTTTIHDLLDQEQQPSLEDLLQEGQ